MKMHLQACPSFLEGSTAKCSIIRVAKSSEEENMVHISSPGEVEMVEATGEAIHSFNRRGKA